VRTGSLQSDQVDGIENAQPVDQGPLADAGFSVVARSNPGMVNVLIPNLQNSALAEPAVRQALQIAIDRQSIVDTLWNENYPAATSVLAATTPYYTDESELLAYDPDRANEILDEAGWTLGSDGVREKDGTKLTLRVLLGSVDFELLQQQFKAIGVDLQIREIDPAQYVETLNSGDYELAPYNLTRPDPSVLTALFNSTLQNVPHFTDGPLDDLLTKLSQETDPDERAAIAGEVQRSIIEDAYALPTVEQAQVYAFSSDLQDVYLEASSRLYLHGTWVGEG
jgi:peptide/nickel transport system substrate-binding protein